MTNTVRSLTEEGLGIGWFILATQTTGWIQNICIFQGIISIICAIYFALQP
jgi:hypothetical protein